MARFYLSLHECGTVTPDGEGLELADLEAARVRAMSAARDVMSAEVKDGRLCLSCCIVIEDGDHHEVARLQFRDAIALTGV